jgi:polysaccharide pyruvyl transferase WcaK-like protein
MTLRRRIKRLRNGLRRTTHTLVAASGLPSVVDRTRFLRTRTAPEGPDATRWHVLVAPPGGGNIGDQAMVEAFLENTTGGIRIVVRTGADITVPAEHAGRVELHPLSSLIHGGGHEHRAAIEGYRRLLSSARSVTVVGADAMDGAYDVRASVRRADVATLARRLGLDARILGFSWNGKAHPGARRALVRAGRAGVLLLVRDPVSAERARADGLPRVTEVADAVFSARTVSSRPVTEYLGAAPGPYVVVNASGLVARSVDQVTEYAGIVRSCLDAGLAVVLLPHVLRSSSSDLTACRALLERVDDPRVILIERQLAPAEVRGLCAGARFVLAGRMHLAIQALWSAVPAITISTQGKVEGLMRLLGTETLCVDPAHGLADRVHPLISDVLARRDWYRTQIAGRLPDVRALADLNFQALSEKTTSPALEQETT